MPSLVSDTQRAIVTGALYDHFLTFSAFNDVIVFKEPIKVINTGDFITGTVYPGYDPTPTEVDYTYIAVSGTFPAMVMYKNNQPLTNISELNKLILSDGKVKIKVLADAAKYINEGRTEYISVNGHSFNVVTDESVQNYLGLKFYIYGLEGTT